MIVRIPMRTPAPVDMIFAVPLQLIGAEDVASAVGARVDSDALTVRFGMVGIRVVLADAIACIIRLSESGDRQQCLSPSD